MKKMLKWIGLALVMQTCALPAPAFAESPDNCTPGTSCLAIRYIARATQGTASSQCLIQGGTGNSGVCLGGYPGVFGALYLGVTPSARDVGNYIVAADGTNANVNGASNIIFRVAGTAQWNVSGTELKPQTDNAESLGSSTIAPSNTYSWAYNSRLNAQFVSYASPTASACTATNPAFLFRQTTSALDANDLLLDFQDLTNASKFKVDIEGDATFAGEVRAKNIAKAWFEVDADCSTATCSLGDSYNTTSVTRSAAGSYVWNIDTDLASASFAVVCTMGGSFGFISATSTTAGTVNISVANTAGAFVDSTFQCAVWDN